MDRRRARKKPLSLFGDPADPRGFVVLGNQFIEHLGVRGFTARTQEIRRKALAYFMQWAAERGILQPSEVTKPILQRYQRHLYHYRKSDGLPLSHGTQHGRL